MLSFRQHLHTSTKQDLLGVGIKFVSEVTRAEHTSNHGMIKATYGFRRNRWNWRLNEVYVDVPTEVTDDLGLDLSRITGARCLRMLCDLKTDL